MSFLPRSFLNYHGFVIQTALQILKSSLKMIFLHFETFLNKQKKVNDNFRVNPAGESNE